MVSTDVKRCAVCSKALPEDYIGDKCSLCAIGLTPLRDTDEDSRPSAIPEGRTLAGVECPNCHADLTLADLGRGNCAICGSPLPPTLTDPTLGQLRHSRLVNRPAQEPSASARTWPNDAPLW